MNRKSVIKVWHWEDDEYIIEVFGKPVGQTLHESEAHRIANWLGTALNEIVAHDRQQLLKAVEEMGICFDNEDWILKAQVIHLLKAKDNMEN